MGKNTMARRRRIPRAAGTVRSTTLMLSGCLLLPATLAMWPDTARAQSLEAALASVYQSNPMLLSERAKLRATDEKLPQALSNWRPKVSLNFAQGISDYGAPAGGVTPPSPSHNFVIGTAPQAYGIAIAQPVYRGGRTDAEKTEALNLIRGERAKLLLTEQEVFLAGVKDYLDVVLAAATLDLNVEHLTLAQHELQVTRGRFNAGELTQTDVAQAEATYANAVAERQRADAAVHVANAAFVHDIGFAPRQLHTPSAAPLLPVTREAAMELAGRNNPAVIAGGFAIDAAQSDVRLIRGELLPTLTLNARVDQERSTFNNNAQTDNKEVYAELSVPLYEAGSVYSRSRQAQQTVAQLRNDYEEARRVAILAASQAWDDKQSQDASLLALDREVKADQISLDGVKSEQAVGARTELDVLTAEETLFQAKLAQVQAEHDKLLAEFTLEAATGQLTAAGLGIRVAPYDADEHLQAVRDKWYGLTTPGDAGRAAVAPAPAKYTNGGYYDIGEPGTGVVVPQLDQTSTRDYIGAQASSGGQPRQNPNQAVDSATLAALNDYDHDLRPRTSTSKWMDSGDP